MSINKRANLVTDNTVELIIAAAGIVVLIFLLIALYSPTYDENGETAKSYLGMFNEQVAVADSGLEGSLTFWGPEEDKIRFYLVYFGNVQSFEKDGINFVNKKRSENTICVCYGNEDKMTCKSCKKLDLPVELTDAISGVRPDPWILNPVKQLKINEEGDKYSFSMVGGISSDLGDVSPDVTGYSNYVVQVGARYEGYSIGGHGVLVSLNDGGVGVLTANHVIGDEEDSISIFSYGEKGFERGERLSIIRRERDTSKEVALLRTDLDARSFPIFKIRTDPLEVGDKLFILSSNINGDGRIIRESTEVYRLANNADMYGNPVKTLVMRSRLSAGASGSPVFDENNYLVGILSHDGDDEGGHWIAAVPSIVFKELFSDYLSFIEVADGGEEIVDDNLDEFNNDYEDLGSPSKTYSEDTIFVREQDIRQGEKIFYYYRYADGQWEYFTPTPGIYFDEEDLSKLTLWYPTKSTFPSTFEEGVAFIENMEIESEVLTVRSFEVEGGLLVEETPDADSEETVSSDYEYLGAPSTNYPQDTIFVREQDIRQGENIFFYYRFVNGYWEYSQSFPSIYHEVENATVTEWYPTKSTFPSTFDSGVAFLEKMAAEMDVITLNILSEDSELIAEWESK